MDYPVKPCCSSLACRFVVPRLPITTRTKPPGHYAKLLYKRCTPDHDWMVTDHRFPHEMENPNPAVQLVTLRLFRSAVPIPPADDLTEHANDHLLTDFLLVAPGDHDKAIELFPQFKHYVVDRGDLGSRYGEAGDVRRVGGGGTGLSQKAGLVEVGLGATQTVLEDRSDERELPSKRIDKDWPRISEGSSIDTMSLLNGSEGVEQDP